MKKRCIIFLIAANCLLSANLDANVDSCQNVAKVTAIGLSITHCWIGTDNGLWRIKRSNGDKVLYTTKNSKLPSNFVSSIAIDQNGQVWVGTNNGILRYDNFTFYSLTKENIKLPDYNITAIHIDDQNNIWIGTKSEGLVFMKPNLHTTIISSRRNNLLSDSIAAIACNHSGKLIISFANSMQNEIQLLNKKCCVVTDAQFSVKIPNQTILLSTSNSCLSLNSKYAIYTAIDSTLIQSYIKCFYSRAHNRSYDSIPAYQLNETYAQLKEIFTVIAFNKCNFVFTE